MNENGETADNINFKLTDELWEEMADLEGVPIASIVIWDSSLVDEDMDEPVTDENRMYVDCELYLANQTLLELYGAAVLPDEDSEPLVGLEVISTELSDLAEEGAVVQEISADQDESMVLTLTTESGRTLLVFTSAWIESTWDDLPDDEED